MEDKTVDKTVHDSFELLLNRMHQTFASKDRAYAGDVPLANIRRSERIGVPPAVACFIRMTDKFSRMETLIRNVNAGAGDESMLDNAFDLAVYALIFMILKDEETGVAVKAAADSLSNDLVGVSYHVSTPPQSGSGVSSLLKRAGLSTDPSPELVAINLYSWYMAQFQTKNPPLPWTDLDPVVQSAWIETAKKVLLTYHTTSTT